MSSEIHNLKQKRELITWRRDIVLQRIAQGYNQTAIAKELQVHQSTISLDCQYLRCKAQDNLKTHISDTVPFEFMRAMAGLNNVLKEVTKLLGEATDVRTKLQCNALLAEIYKSLINLNTDAVYIEQSIKKVESLQKQVQESVVIQEEQKTIDSNISEKVEEEEYKDEEIEIEIEEEEDENKEND
jgi:hypothetical protein